MITVRQNDTKQKTRNKRKCKICYIKIKIRLYDPLKQSIVSDSTSCQIGEVTKPKVLGWQGPYWMDQFPRWMNP